MKRSVLLLLFMLSLLTASAGETVTVATGDAGDFSYHARFMLSGKASHRISLSWRDEADTSLVTAAVELPPAIDDPLFPAICRYYVTRLHNDSTAICAEGRFETHFGNPPEISIVLRRSAAGTAVSFGADGPEAAVAVAYDADSLTVTTSDGAKMQRQSLIIRNRRNMAKSKFKSEKEIAGYLAASTDPMEGEWIYLDRDLDLKQARLGGRYRLATIASGDGYDIVYLDGADAKWTVGDIKGRLRNTPFEGHYDLEWLTAEHRNADSEASAGVVTDGLILELNFPMLGSRMRFRRAR